MEYSNKKIYIFIKYTPQRTLRSRWYLVQVKLAITPELNLKTKEQGMYYCMFFKITIPWKQFFLTTLSTVQT